MEETMARKQKPTIRTWYAIIVLVIAMIIVGVGATLLFKQPAVVTDFEECEKAGGDILTTYPEQCTIRGKTFTNTASKLNDRGKGYVGLTENVALEKASAANVPARVVERDGEALPVTMDYVLGRLNFYVKDGVVYKITVEGQTAN